MKFFHKIILLIIAIYIPYTQTILAQEAGNEFWNSMILKHKFNKKISILGQATVKSDLKQTDLKQVYAEFGLMYEPFKYLETAIQYKHITSNPLENTYVHKYRLMADMEGKLPLNRLELSLRMRYQRQYVYVWEYPVKQVPSQYLRFKYNLSYNISDSPIEPYAYAEWYYPILEGGLYKRRSYKLGTGIDWKLLKNYSVEIEYFFEKEIIPDIEKAHVFQLTYIIKI